MIAKIALYTYIHCTLAQPLMGRWDMSALIIINWLNSCNGYVIMAAL